jgi:hypothetical protein
MIVSTLILKICKDLMYDMFTNFLRTSSSFNIDFFFILEGWNLISWLSYVKGTLKIISYVTSMIKTLSLYMQLKGTMLCISTSDNIKASNPFESAIW